MVIDRMITARDHRMARLARRRERSRCSAQLALKAIQLWSSAYLLCVDCELTVGEVLDPLLGHSEMTARELCELSRLYGTLKSSVENYRCSEVDTLVKHWPTSWH
jgi:hypothetical protein